MATVNIWAGTSSFVANQMTPFALYDSDSTFQSDTTKVADWCARRLGYPIIDVELQSGSFFACFEEAVTEYGAQLNTYNIRDNLINLYGAETGSKSNEFHISFETSYNSGAFIDSLNNQITIGLGKKSTTASNKG